MKTTTTHAAFSGLLSATSAQIFSLMSLRSGSPIHFSGVSASGHSLWLGDVESATYCPESVAEQGGCPNSTITTFVGGTGGLSMGASVPGGQYVYIEPDFGAVMYTVAHSDAMPRGAITDGWSLEPGVSSPSLNWKNGLLACPSDANGASNAWKIHAAIDGVEFAEDCLGFGTLVSNATGVGAWQYG